MNRLIFVIALFLSGTYTAHAVPCAPGSLNSYSELGTAGCTINSAQFANFAIIEPATGATQILPGDIAIVPIDAPSNPGLQFIVDIDAQAAELFQGLITFDVTAAALTGNTLALGNATATGDAAVTVTNDLCLGGSFAPNSVSGCSGDPGTLIVFKTAVDELLSDQMLFPAVGFIGVVTDIAVDGGLAGSGSLASTSVQFAVTQATVPEPQMLMLFTMGLWSLTLIHKRRRLVPRTGI